MEKQWLARGGFRELFRFRTDVVTSSGLPEKDVGKQNGFV